MPIKFLQSMMVGLKKGDKLGGVVMARYKSDDNYTSQVRIIHHDNPDSLKGLVTTAMSYCVCAAVIDRDEHNNIDKIAMVHFPGGIKKEMLDSLMCAIHGFSSKKELIVYPGVLNTSARIKNSTRELLDQYKDQFPNGYHYNEQCSNSCCVTFDGQVGTFDDSPYISNVITIKQLREQKIIEEFDQLESIYPTNKVTLDQLKNAILSEPSTKIRYELLEITRQLLINIYHSPSQERQQLYNDYVKNVKQMPRLSPLVKGICIALTLTVIGALPAAGIAIYKFFASGNQRIKEINSTKNALNKLCPQSIVAHVAPS